MVIIGCSLSRRPNPYLVVSDRTVNGIPTAADVDELFEIYPMMKAALRALG